MGWPNNFCFPVSSPMITTEEPVSCTVQIRGKKKFCLGIHFKVYNVFPFLQSNLRNHTISLLCVPIHTAYPKNIFFIFLTFWKFVWKFWLYIHFK